MILHTIVPYENIFNQESDTQAPESITVGNGYIEADKSEDGRSIRRLISTLPSDYLNPKYSPGQKL